MVINKKRKERRINARTIAIESDKIINAQANNTFDTRKSAMLATGNVGKALRRSMRK